MTVFQSQSKCDLIGSTKSLSRPLCTWVLPCQAWKQVWGLLRWPLPTSKYNAWNWKQQQGGHNPVRWRVPRRWSFRHSPWNTKTRVKTTENEKKESFSRLDRRPRKRKNNSNYLPFLVTAHPLTTTKKTSQGFYLKILPSVVPTKTFEVRWQYAVAYVLGRSRIRRMINWTITWCAR